MVFLVECGAPCSYKCGCEAIASVGFWMWVCVCVCVLLFSYLPKSSLRPLLLLHAYILRDGERQSRGPKRDFVQVRHVQGFHPAGTRHDKRSRHGGADLLITRRP